MQYDTAIQFLLSLADFERSPRPPREAEAFKLDRIRSLLARLGHPEAGRHSIHIAGSKGKGSTAAMVESMLRAAGRRTGLYTSPHLHEFPERIRIDGQPVAPDTFADLVARLQPVISADLAETPGRVTTFEALTAMAFLAFRDAAVRVQVIEVGLGGRLDTTNVLPAKEAAVITALSDEHRDILGGTLPAIAAEKAGIITPGTRAVVLGPQRSEAAAAVVRNRAAALGVPLVETARRYRWERAGQERWGQWFRLHREQAGPELPPDSLYLLPLLGEHQIENAVTAIATIEAVRGASLPVPREAIHTGLATVLWPGRLEVLGRDPLLVVDGAHNVESMERVLGCLPDYFAFSRLIVVFGTLQDKDVAGMAARLAAAADIVVVTAPQHPRAADPADVATQFPPADRLPLAASDVATALDLALDQAGPDDLVLALGSLFVAAEARTDWLRRQGLAAASAGAERPG